MARCLFKHALFESKVNSKRQTSNEIFLFNSMLKCLVNSNKFNLRGWLIRHIFAILIAHFIWMFVDNLIICKYNKYRVKSYFKIVMMLVMIKDRLSIVLAIKK